MAQNFIACDREQELLLPPSLREWLPQDHFACYVLVNDYQGHPSVRTLIVVIYDLDGVWKNPAGFENDLARAHSGLDVRVVVVPWVGPRS